MQVGYRNPGMQSMIESALAFQTDGESAYWLDGLYAFYPQIDKNHALSLNWEERNRYITQMLVQIYQENELVINEKIEKYRNIGGKINHKLKRLCQTSSKWIAERHFRI